MKNIKFLLSVIFLFVFSLSAKAKDFSFVVMGDNRPGRGRYTQPYVFKKIIDKINNLKPLPDFVLSTGDIIAGYTHNKKLLDKEFYSFKKTIEKLKVPYYNAPGNHEISNNEYALEKYKEIFPYLPGNKLYYSFNYRGAHFIALNTEEIYNEGRICCEQFKWLKHDLEKNKKAKHIFVFFHRPLYPVAGHIGSSLDEFPEDRDTLVNLLKKYKVDYVFCGHEHLYNKTKKNNIIQIITGGAGAGLRVPPEDGGFFHFVLVSVKENKVTLKVIKINDEGE